MRIELQVTTAAAVQQAFLASPEIVLDELETATGNALFYLKRETQERTPTAFGTLRAAFASDYYSSPLLTSVFGELTNVLPYALPVELGSRPHFPPIEPLLDWVEAKLGLSGDEAESAARGIQRKIGRQGTPGYGMARHALIDGRSTIEGEYREALERIGERIGSVGGQGATQ